MKQRAKTVVAIVGGVVVVAMGMLTVTFGGTEAHAKVVGGSGETVTQTTPPSTPAIASASPVVKATPPSA
ncbi:MAG: hypothetical protein ACXVLX_17790 [Ilumatobacteraceae bacterium]